MNKSKLEKHGGRFTSIMVSDGRKTISYSAKIIKVTEKTIQFRDRNSGEIITKKLTSLL